MSYRNKPYRDKPDTDRRSMVLEKESEKLRREISELEDALILHSRFENERETSVRGLIRKEIGSSHWEHGGEGKMRTYRSQHDLCEGAPNSTRSVKQSHQMKKGRQNVEGRKQSLQKPTSKEKKTKPSLNTSSVKSKGLSSRNSEKMSKGDKADLEVSCIKGEWNLSHSYWKSKQDGDNFKTRSPSVNPAKASGNNVNMSAGLGKSTSLEKSMSSDIRNISQEKMLSGDQIQGSTKVRKRKDLKMSASQLPHRMNEHDAVDDEVSLHYEPLFKAFETSPFQALEQGLSSYCLQKDDTCMQKLNTSFRQTKCEKSQLKETMEECSEIETSKFLNSTFPNPHEDSLKINSKMHCDLEKALVVQHKKKRGHTDQSEIKPGNSDDSPSHIDTEVASWLQSLGLHSTQNYVGLFAQHQMDMSSVKLLSATQLREMGIHALGPIMKIMKGVQILGRRNSIEDVVKASPEEINDFKKELELEGSKSSHKDFRTCICSKNRSGEHIHLTSRKDDEMIQNASIEKEINLRPKLQRPLSINKNTTKEKRPLQSSVESGWRETSDPAEFLNLNDRSPMSDLDVPMIVAVKETGQVNDTAFQKKTKPSKNMLKSAKKPPAAASSSGKTTYDDLLAAQKYTEKQKHLGLKERAEGRATSRRREKRDEMAARHHVRRSSSVERDVHSSPHRHYLQRSSSFTNKNKKNDFEQISITGDSLEEITKRKSDDKKEKLLEKNRGKTDSTHEIKMDEIASVLKDIPDDGTNNQEDSKLLTLGVVRELKKQLNDLEQHLVQTQVNQSIVIKEGTEMKIDTTLSEITSKQETQNHSPRFHLDLNKGENNTCPKETLSDKKSARERRREKLMITVEQNKKEEEQIKVSYLEERPVDNLSISHSSESFAASNVNVQSQSRVSYPPRNAELYLATRKSKIISSCDEGKRTSSSYIPQKKLNVNIDETSPLNNKDAEMVESESMLNQAPTIYKTQRVSNVTEYQNAMVYEDRLRKIEIDKQDIQFEQKNMLGEGVFSQVFKGTYQGSQVAIKLLRAPLLSADKNYFYSEVSLLQELRHPHVAMLLGICTSKPRPIMVLELMEGGNLFARLHNSSLPHLSKADVYQISRDVASGVSYLHHHRPPVLHLDLKSRNILLGQGGHAKVADFGFSKLKHEADIKVSRASKPRALSGSPAWMAPELLAAGEITVKADVYSFAIVLWEMITREHPYDGCSMFQILEHVRLSRRPKLPPGYPQTLTHLITKCWEPNPAARPVFKEILKSLDNVFLRSEHVTWPVDSVLENLNENAATAESKSVKSNNQNYAEDTEEVMRSSFDTQVKKTNSEDNIDVRSISSDDMEHLEFENEISHDYKRNVHSDEKTKDNKEMHIHKKTIDANDTIFPESSSELNARESAETTRLSTSVSNSNPSLAKMTTGLPIASPRLVSSPRIREMAKKQAEERSSSVSLSHSLNVTSEVTNTKAAPATLRETVGFPHDDKDLETLIKKYLPSPRNRSLMKQSVTQSVNMTERLLPLRQSLDKPKKPPKPRKSQNLLMPSQSLNFDHSPVNSDRFAQFEPKQNNHLSSQGIPTVSHTEPHLIKKQRENKELSQINGSAYIDPVNVGGGPDIQDENPERESPSHALHIDYPAHKHLTRSMQSLKKPQLNISSETSPYTYVTASASSSSHFGDQEKDVAILTKSTAKCSNVNSFPMSNDHNPLLSPETNLTEVIEDKSETEAKTKKLSVSNDNTKEPKMANASLNDLDRKEYADKGKGSLPFLSELQEKSILKEEKSGLSENGKPSFDIKDRYLYDNKNDIPATSATQLYNDPSNEPKIEALSKQLVNEHLPSSSLTDKTDPSDNYHSDSESSIHTDFSADSLSMTLSEDDESIDSIEITNSGKKGNNHEWKGSKARGRDVGRMPPIKKESMESQVQVKKVCHDKKPKNSNVRESFFLFDDFKLKDDHSKTVIATHTKDRITNVTTDGKRMHDDLNKSEKDEDSLVPFVLDVKAIKSKSIDSRSQPQELSNQDYPHATHSKRKTSGVNPKSSKKPVTIQLSHEPRHFHKSDNENLGHNEQRQIKQTWPAPPVPIEQPGKGPLRSALFSLEASMLIKQKGQLKSVAVTGPSTLKERKKEMKNSLPSVASILKKAIEERRFALGDNLESQDMTPEASWSLQDEDV